MTNFLNLSRGTVNMDAIVSIERAKSSNQEFYKLFLSNGKEFVASTKSDMAKMSAFIERVEKANEAAGLDGKL